MSLRIHIQYIVYQVSLDVRLLLTHEHRLIILFIRGPI